MIKDVNVLDTQGRIEADWHRADIESVLRNANSTAGGLSTLEARERLARYGPNELQEERGVSPLTLFLGQFKSLLVLILIAAGVISAGMGEVVEAVAIFVIVVLAGVLGFLQEYHAGKAIASLRKMASPNATVLRDGIETIIPSRELVPGDIILLKSGDRIPVDARVLQVMTLKVDEAPLTGESIPVEKNSAAIPAQDAPLGDRRNMLYMGTLVTYGRGRAVVVETGMQTEFGKIADMLRTTESRKTPLQTGLDRLGKLIGIFAIALAAVISLFGVFRGYAAVEMFVWGVALAVAIIPEALPAVVTITLALGVRRMVKRRALIRKLPAVETLGATSVICSDKTGTLTEDQMTVRQIFVNGIIIDVEGAGYAPVGEFKIRGERIDIAANKHLNDLLMEAALCNDASLRHKEGNWEIIGDPTEGALIVLAAKAGVDRDALVRLFPRVYEIPFSSERKRMTTVHQFPDGLFAFSKGAPEMILAECSQVRKQGKDVQLDDEMRNEITNVAHTMGNNALRVLAFSMKRVVSANGLDDSIERDMVFLGLVGMMDPPRLEAKSAIEVCEKAGIRTIMITGDHKITAVAVARELGILKHGGVLTGSELEALSDGQLDNAVESMDVYARISPAHKLRIVSALQKKGHIAAMTGDGVNDAPALKRADIGVAMGITGTDVSKEAADMILTDDNFASIVAAVEEGRSIFENIRKYLIFLLSGNMGTVFAMVVALLANLPLPLAAVQILFINFIMDGLIAIALGVEPPEPGIMRKPPRNVREGILNRPALWYIGGAGALIAIITLAVFVWALEAGYSATEAMTMFFVTLILARLFNGFNCRSLDDSVFRLGPFTNKQLIYSTIAALFLTMSVLYVDALRVAFNTVPLSPVQWMVAFAASSVVLIIVELWKHIHRIGGRTHSKGVFGARRV